MQIALSCNNSWGLGGQGNFLRRASCGLLPHGNLDVYCTTASAGIDPDFGIRPVGASGVAGRLQKIPLVRSRKDWVTLVSDMTFDRRVAARLTAAAVPPDLFVGVAMQAAHSMRAVKKRGGHPWLYCLNAHIPFVKEQVDREYAELEERGGMIHPMAVRQFRQECDLAEVILVNSSFAEHTFREAGITDKPVHVIHPVVDANRFRPSPSDAEERPFTILYVGMINPRKGVHYLVKAVNQLDPAQFRLTMVGGASTRKMKQLLDEVLAQPNSEQIFKDFSKDDPVGIIGKADVLVLPSVEDGFGVVALEAMACGVPVIVTSHCGAADAVQDGKNGFVVPPRDADAIAQRLQWLIDHRDHCREMRAHAREAALRFSQERYNADLDAIVRQHFHG